MKSAHFAAEVVQKKIFDQRSENITIFLSVILTAFNKPQKT